MLISHTICPQFRYYTALLLLSVLWLELYELFIISGTWSHHGQSLDEIPQSVLVAWIGLELALEPGKELFHTQWLSPQYDEDILFSKQVSLGEGGM